jgi:pSer/pThr/pTyr-binding forkhead associated (FHA) protein
VVSAAEGVLNALLYLFLLQLFWVLWRDLARAQRGAAGTSLGLTVIEAPLELAQTAAGALEEEGVAYTVGQTFQLPSPATIGRAPGNTLSVPAETVSLSHLRVVYRNRGWWVEDLGSTNGTFVNGTRISGLTRLAAGDMLGCGPHVRFRLHDVPATQ